MTEPGKAFRRSGVKREIRTDWRQPAAEAVVGPITHGMDVFGLSTGAFSLIDLLTHCLDAAGPADVTISCWTASGKDIEECYRRLVGGGMRSVRFLMDFSHSRRKPEWAQALRDRFGDGAIRVTKNHSKFAIVRNEEWALVIRASMNLNRNLRLESFDISDDAAMADWLLSVVDWMFERESAPLDSPPGVPQWDYDHRIAGGAATSYDASPLGRDVERIGLAPWGSGLDAAPVGWDGKRAGLTGWRGGKVDPESG